jgi:hypothetical protein
MAFLLFLYTHFLFPKLNILLANNANNINMPPNNRKAPLSSSNSPPI